MPPVGCCRPLPTYCARLCAWAENTWWEVLIGVANKMQYLRRSWTLPNDSKHNEANFSTTSTDKSYLRVAQIPRSPDLAIFVLTTDDRQTDRRQTKPITLPLAHARGVIIWCVHCTCVYCVIIISWYDVGVLVTEVQILWDYVGSYNIDYFLWILFATLISSYIVLGMSRHFVSVA